ncbi:SDR family oxidoreductase [Sphingomonas jatrophae]|uniref:NAD(P)-dependent dehydrogenase, short-chain alcohol dehydrogenase family n=1 Tax=Sphingomonas jatrophae TaxID=1166337 RepID=A0A1I6M167_9SPHN|nr:SDR family oxidoreductase [Sphingomonas jatrophae]SFS09450.1 NAD(P)-dependent dehydrogenase, short-chain alcohol dehydrogenase family [Sphingomonas jatrophae]
MKGIEGKVAIVTGAASGLGLAIAARLDAAGATVVSTDIDEAGGIVAAGRLARGAFMRHDVASEDDWSRVVAETKARFGPLGILVNNAGITTVGSIEDVSYAAFRHELDIDLCGTFLGCQAAVRAMREDGGAIVNISSASGLKASSWLVAYNAAKAGVTLMTKSIALHCGEKGYAIRCNAVHPGVIEGPMIEKAGAQTGDVAAFRAGLVKTHPIGHLGEPADIAAMVAFLVSDEAAFATGASFVVDGGLTL